MMEWLSIVFTYLVGDDGMPVSTYHVGDDGDDMTVCSCVYLSY